MRYVIIQPLGARVYGDECIHIVQCTYTYYEYNDLRQGSHRAVCMW